MIITHHGIQSFKVSFGDITLAFDPVSKDSKKHDAWRAGADITLVSINNPDMNGHAQASRGDKETFLVKGPGEYEIQGIFIKGLESFSEYGGKEILNTIYTVNMEGMNICFLGALGNPSIPPATKESIEGIDILFVPIGGDGVLSPHDAYKFAVSLEPSIIVPMNYSEDSLKLFLKESGSKENTPVDKLTIKKKDLEGKEGEVVVIKE